MLLNVPHAWAELDLSPTSNFPSNTTLGDTNLTFQINVTNTSNETGNASDPTIPVELTEVGLTPSCATFSGLGVCIEPELDVFDIDTGATAATGIDGACVGTTFDVSARDADGRHTLTPNTPVLLGPADGSGGPTNCTLEVTILEVIRVPDVDVSGDAGIQTRRQIDAQIEDSATGRTGQQSQNAIVTVNPSQVTLFTESDPSIFAGTSPVPPGSTATDTATITRINPETDPDPTGDVTFQLIGPNPNADCTAPAPVFESTAPVDPATGQAESGPSGPLNDPGGYNWIATYASGDNNYESIPDPVGCNEDQERFVVAQAPTVAVDKTADPTSQPEPGGTFTFNVEVTNTGVNDVTITSLTDDVYGDLLDPANPDVENNTCPALDGTTLAPDESTTCSFDGEFTGSSGDAETDTVTVTVEDEFGQEATDDDDATVTLTGVPPMVDLVKTADPTSQPEPGGTFTFDVEITNTSDQEVITLDALTDDIYGDLFDPANPNVENNTCAALEGTTLDPGEATTCSFDGEFTGNADDSQTDTVTVEVSDDDGETATASDDATVTLTPGPTIQVVKTADPTARQEPGGTFTFSVEVTNTHDQSLVITSLTDDVYGDIGDPANPNVTNNDCPDLIGQTLAPDESTTCSFDGEFTGNAGDSETDTVTVVGTDEFGNEATDDDDATVTLTAGEPPTVSVDKTADPTSQPEPGGTFTFNVEVTNTGVNDVTITSLTDDVYGDLLDPANPDVENNTCPALDGTTLAPDESTTCSFDGEFTGSAGDEETDTVTVVVEDEDGNPAQDEDDATVTLTAGEPPTVRVDKSADPVSQPEPGGSFTFTVEITNTSDETVTITSLTDDVYGDLLDPANPDVENNTCPALDGTTLAPDESTTCSFDGEFTGSAGDEETDTVTVVVEDEDGNPAQDEDDATVVIITPGPEAAPQIQVDKDANPQSRPEPGGSFTFTVEVSNVGNVPVTITEITDDVYGNLANRAGSDCDELIGERLAVGERLECSFTVQFLGNAGDGETDVVTVKAEDDEGRPVEDSDDETIFLTGGPPPPPDGPTTIVLNSSSSSSSSSSAAAAGGGGPRDEKKVVERQQAQQKLTRTGADSLPVMALGLALMVLGWLALAGHRQAGRQRG
ncbi:MAG: hypothetical protein WD602_03635 [Actinomycetota bacterium]